MWVRERERTKPSALARSLSMKTRCSAQIIYIVYMLGGSIHLYFDLNFRLLKLLHSWRLGIYINVQNPLAFAACLIVCCFFLFFWVLLRSFFYFLAKRVSYVSIATIITARAECAPTLNQPIHFFNFILARWLFPLFLERLHFCRNFVAKIVCLPFRSTPKVNRLKIKKSFLVLF